MTIQEICLILFAGVVAWITHEVSTQDRDKRINSLERQVASLEEEIESLESKLKRKKRSTT